MGRNWYIFPVFPASVAEPELVSESVSRKIQSHAVFHAGCESAASCGDVQFDVQCRGAVPICVHVCPSSWNDESGEKASHGRCLLEFCPDGIASGAALEHDPWNVRPDMEAGRQDSSKGGRPHPELRSSLRGVIWRLCLSKTGAIDIPVFAD